MNTLIIVGKLVSAPELVNGEDGKKESIITLGVKRYYENSNGEYETDFIKCVLLGNVAETTCKYCEIGDVIGIKGKLRSSKIEDSNGNTHFETEVMADKITFLSKGKEEK